MVADTALNLSKNLYMMPTMLRIPDAMRQFFVLQNFKRLIRRLHIHLVMMTQDISITNILDVQMDTADTPGMLLN